MSDDDDYMSSTFLAVKEDIRPGLLPKSVKRKLDIEKKKVESHKIFKTKSRKELEEESRNVGLDLALDSNNKGFAMLQKMGYKPGMKLGPEKGNSSDCGLTEPIRVKVKAGRGGLGQEDEVRLRIQKREEQKKKLKVYREQETQLLTEEFRERMKNKREDKRMMRDLHNCQKVCEQLDVENHVEEPMRSWFWYTQEDKDDEEEADYEEEEEEQEDLRPSEKIEFICDYIRPKYFYCFWCSIKYDSEDDLLQNCPGPDKDSHEDLLS